MGEKVSTRQGYSLLILFLIGTTTVMTPGREANREIWLTVPVAFLMAVPFALLFGRLLQLYPDKDLFDMQRELFGPVLGTLSCLCFIFFGFHLGALVIRNFTEFIQIVSMTSIPQYFFALPLGILSIWCLRAHIGTLPRGAVLVMPIVIVLLIINIGASYKLWEWTNLEPFLEDGIGPVAKGATDIWAFPFMETIIVLFALKPLAEPKKGTHVILTAFGAATIILTLTNLRNVLTLGHEEMNKYYYPSYQVVSLINVADFLQGIQVLIILLFLFGGYAKIVSCLYVATLGVSKLTGQHYKSLVAPMGLLMTACSFFVSKNVVDMFKFALIYFRFYIIPISVVLPLLLWVVAEVKTRKQAKLQADKKAQQEQQAAPKKPLPAESEQRS